MSHPAHPSDPYRTPRWVKLLGVVALAAVLLLGLLLATGGPGAHGPRRHLAPGPAQEGAPDREAAPG